MFDAFEAVLKIKYILLECAVGAEFSCGVFEDFDVCWYVSGVWVKVLLGMACDFRQAAVTVAEQQPAADYWGSGTCICGVGMAACISASRKLFSINIGLSCSASIL